MPPGPPAPGKRGKHRNTRKIITRVIVFLIAGATVNVAVAWGSAAVVGFADFADSSRGFRKSTAGIWNVEVYKLPTARRVSWFRSREPGFMDSEGPEPGSLVPAWITHPESLSDDDTWVMWDAEARGAPFLAFWSTTMERRKSNSGVSRMVEASGSIRLPLQWFSGGMGDIPRVLPLRPIWPGFAINTIFYAGILWLLIAVPGVIRKHRRIKRNVSGLCISHRHKRHLHRMRRADRITNHPDPRRSRGLTVLTMRITQSISPGLRPGTIVDSVRFTHS